jgi:hypothetical protein
MSMAGAIGGDNVESSFVSISPTPISISSIRVTSVDKESKEATESDRVSGEDDIGCACGAVHRVVLRIIWR